MAHAFKNRKAWGTGLRASTYPVRPFYKDLRHNLRIVDNSRRAARILRDQGGAWRWPSYARSTYLGLSSTLTVVAVGRLSYQLRVWTKGAGSFTRTGGA